MDVDSILEEQRAQQAALLERVNIEASELPKGTSPFPREKPVPQQKALTRWEKFAAEKDWKPTWGYKRANDEAALPYLEVPAGADPYEDQFQKLAKGKKERVAKNESQRLRNLSSTQAAAAAERQVLKSQLKGALAVSKSSTASLGKFDELVKGEPTHTKGQKRKRDALINSDEKDRALAIAERIARRNPLTFETDAGTAAADVDDPSVSLPRKPTKQGKKRKSQKNPKGKASAGKGKLKSK